MFLSLNKINIKNNLNFVNSVYSKAFEFHRMKPNADKRNWKDICAISSFFVNFCGKNPNNNKNGEISKPTQNFAIKMS